MLKRLSLSATTTSTNSQMFFLPFSYISLLTWRFQFSFLDRMKKIGATIRHIPRNVSLSFRLQLWLRTMCRLSLLTGRFLFPSRNLSLCFFATARCLKSQCHFLKILMIFVLASLGFCAGRTHSPNERCLGKTKKGVNTKPSSCFSFVVSINGHLKASKCSIFFVWFLLQPFSLHKAETNKIKCKLTIQSYCTRGSEFNVQRDLPFFACLKEFFVFFPFIAQQDDDESKL